MTVLFIPVRAVHLGAVMLLLGTFAFSVLVARPAFAKGGPLSVGSFERLDRLLLRLAGSSLLVVLGSGLLWLWIQAGIVTGRPLGSALDLEALGGVLTRTQFGQVWQLRLAIAVILGGFLLLREREEDVRDWMALRLPGAALGGALVVALAWVGHAAATQGTGGLVHQAVDAVHLLAAGAWLGGLPALALPPGSRPEIP